MRALLKLCCWLAAAFVMALPAFADEIRPALLEVTERAGDLVDVTWKVPTRGDRTLALAPVLPDFFALAAPPVGRLVNDAWVEHTSYSTGGQPLTGAAIVVDGLAGMSTDVLLRIRLADGTEHSAVLRGSYPEFTIPPVPSRLEVASSYWEMGTLHILEGYDHLLFLLTLLLIVTGIWPLLKTVTAFTVAHSLTLALATLGFVEHSVPAHGGRDFTQYSPACRRGIAQVRWPADSRGAVSMAHRILFRPRARARIRRCACRNRVAAE